MARKPSRRCERDSLHAARARPDRWLNGSSHLFARAELEDILDYIATDSGSVAVAEKVADDFMAALDKLAASPGIGWKRAHLTGTGIRWWRVHSYLLIYEADSEPLRVIRILHGARDLERIFRRGK